MSARVKATAVRWRLSTLGTIALSTLCSTTVAAGPPDQVDAAARLDAALEQVVQAQSLSGAGLVVLNSRGEIYRHVVGRFDADESTAIASASKWLTAAMVMSLVTANKLKLDTTVGEVLPDYPLQVRGVTLQQLLSHTAGIEPDLALRSSSASSLDDSARSIAKAPLRGEPGKLFAYGGSSMQIAARMAEVTCGCTWAELYERTLRSPLRLSGGRWGHPLRPESKVPQVAGGLNLSLNDYVRFLTMILNGGRANDRTVLTAAAIEAMERDVTRSVTRFEAARVVPQDWRYGIGIWCERVEADGQCSLVSSAGALGVYPWVDRELGMAGVFFTRAPLPKVLPAALGMRAIASELPH